MEDTVQFTFELLMVYYKLINKGLLLTVLDEVQFQSKPIRADSFSGEVMHSEVALIAVELLKALVLGADIMGTRELVEFNKEGTKEFLFICLSVSILGRDFVP